MERRFRLIWRLTTPPSERPYSEGAGGGLQLELVNESTLGKMTTVCSQVSLLSTPSSMKLLSRARVRWRKTMPRLATPGCRRRRYWRRECRGEPRDRAGKIDEITAVQRKRQDLFVGHRRAQFGRRRLEQWRAASTLTDSDIEPTSSFKSI